MIGDGMVSRLIVIEYMGKREYSNENPVMKPPMNIVNLVADLVSCAMKNNISGQHIDVKTSIDAKTELRRIDRESDDIINEYNEQDESNKVVNFFTRRLLKIKKVAAILAVLKNHNDPTIDIEHVLWARHLIDQCIGREMRWLRQGAVSGAVDDSAIDDFFMSKIDEFAAKPVGDPKTIKLARNGVLSLGTLHDIARKIPAIADHKDGLKDRYKAALSSLCDRGLLVYVGRNSAKEKFGLGNICYVIPQRNP